jgi:hypothetical protein
MRRRPYRRRKSYDNDATVSQPSHSDSLSLDTGRKGGRNSPRTALKTLTDFSGFYNAPNEINGANQTTNLGIRSSNLFGRAST